MKYSQEQAAQALKAVNKSIVLWKWMRANPRASKSDWPGHSYEAVNYFHCPLCEFAGVRAGSSNFKDCVMCPASVEWKKYHLARNYAIALCERYGTPWERWLVSHSTIYADSMVRLLERAKARIRKQYGLLR